jgi:hypothetical protein
MRRKIQKLEKSVQQFKSRARFTNHPGDDKMIPAFDPQKTDLALESWVRRVDELADTYEWDSLRTVRLVYSLGGMARLCDDSQDQLISSWKNIKKKLIKQFPLPFAKLLIFLYQHIRVYAESPQNWPCQKSKSSSYSTTMHEAHGHKKKTVSTLFTSTSCTRLRQTSTSVRSLHFLSSAIWIKTAYTNFFVFRFVCILS